MNIYKNNFDQYTIHIKNMTVDKCKKMYDYITKYYDFDDSINQFININDDDDDKILTFYFYGMERNKIYIYAYFNEFDNYLTFHFNMDYNDIDIIMDIALDSIDS